MTTQTKTETPSKSAEIIAHPALVMPKRQYKAEIKSEEEIKAAVRKLGLSLRTHAAQLEGPLFVQLTKLTADYVDLRLAQAGNKRESVKERDVRNFIKVNIGYGDENGRVKANKRSGTLDNLLGVCVQAAYLYHHSHNECAIRWFKGDEMVAPDTKGALAKLAMPFHLWLPKLKLEEISKNYIDNPEKGYRPLPQWAIKAQYMNMLGHPIDPKTGRTPAKRGTGAEDGKEQGEAGNGGDRVKEMMTDLKKAAADGQVTKHNVQTAAVVLLHSLKDKKEGPALWKDPQVRDILSNIFLALDKVLAPEGKGEVPEKKGAVPAPTEERKTA